jgi:glycerol-3-phosphate dehydrogenase
LEQLELMADPSAVLSTPHRRATLRALEAQTFDVLIVGAGISGAGIARAAALLGLSVAVVEANDFASGTSSRSTKLIHGGLRYLAMGDIALVRETAREREQVRRRAPHLAESLWMLLPARSRLAHMRFLAGISLYEWLGQVERRDRHQTWSRSEVQVREPLLAGDRHPFLCAYREYLTDDARLVLANLRSAAARGAVIANYASVVDLKIRNGRACGARVRTEAGDDLRVSARCIVNAAGPWVEEILRIEEPETASGWLQLSKGVHVAIPIARLPIRHMFMLELADGRPIFVIPRGSLVYIGTTDTAFSKEPSLWPRVEAEDVAYLLRPISQFFAVKPLTPNEVVATWAGLRPLIAQPGKQASALSRRDEVRVGRSGMVSIAGGKLTGYRLMANAALLKIGEVLGRKLGHLDDAAPLPGGDFAGDLAALERTISQGRALGPAACARLARLYGSETEQVLARGAEPLPGVEAAFTGEVDWAVHVEGALRLEDVVYRRTRLGIYDARARDALHAIARRMSALLHWSTEQTERETAEVQERLERDTAFRSF